MRLACASYIQLGDALRAFLSPKRSLLPSVAGDPKRPVGRGTVIGSQRKGQGFQVVRARRTRFHSPLQAIDPMCLRRAHAVLNHMPRPRAPFRYCRLAGDLGRGAILMQCQPTILFQDKRRAVTFQHRQRLRKGFGVIARPETDLADR